MRIMVMDAGIGKTRVSILDTDKGVLTQIVKITSQHAVHHGERISDMILEKKPEQLVMDKSGYGMSVWEATLSCLSDRGVQVNEDGILSYSKVNLESFIKSHIGRVTGVIVHAKTIDERDDLVATVNNNGWLWQHHGESSYIVYL
jgi:hypothetical protein